jgi:hypothetical protein
MSKVSRESAPDVTDYGPAEDRGAHFDGCAEASITTTANTGSGTATSSQRVRADLLDALPNSEPRNAW